MISRVPAADERQACLRDTLFFGKHLDAVLFNLCVEVAFFLCRSLSASWRYGLHLSTWPCSS